jgi:hypothetical protein
MDGQFTETETSGKSLSGVGVIFFVTLEVLDSAAHSL